MENEPIKPGDVVQLNSEGPDMTVERIVNSDEGPKACCNWFVGSKPQKEFFRLVELKRKQ